MLLSEEDYADGCTSPAAAGDDRPHLRASVRKAAHCNAADSLRKQQAALQLKEWESLASYDVADLDDDYGEPDDADQQQQQPRSSQQVATAAAQQSPVQPQRQQTPAAQPQQTNLSQASQLALLLASRNAARLAKAAAAA